MMTLLCIWLGGAALVLLVVLFFYALAVPWTELGCAIFSLILWAVLAAFWPLALGLMAWAVWHRTEAEEEDELLFGEKPTRFMQSTESSLPVGGKVATGNFPQVAAPTMGSKDSIGHPLSTPTPQEDA